VRTLGSLPHTAIDLHISLLFGEESLWTFFNNLDPGALPSPEELFQMALSLYDNYSTPTASTIFMTECPDSPIVRIGERWREDEDTEPKPVPTGTNDTDTEQGEGKDRKDGREEGPTTQMNLTEGDEFDGDQTLARSALFMYEALVSKEIAQAVAEGDVGRVYEAIKVSRPPVSNLSLLMMQ